MIVSLLLPLRCMSRTMVIAGRLCKLLLISSLLLSIMLLLARALGHIVIRGPATSWAVLALYASITFTV